MLRSVEVATARPGYELWRPNRHKAQNKTTKAIVALVLLISAALLLIITIGGWERLQGAGVGIVSILWAVMYVVFALLIMRWNRGLLPVSAALAIILAIFAAIAAPDWFARDKVGLDSPALPEDLIGVLTVIVVPVQILLIAVAMIAFSQEWHVEEERPVGGGPMAGDDDPHQAPPGPAEPHPA
jgi:lysylphosphatidylglycerol synthetase-like protein (DUF2156 family)